MHLQLWNRVAQTPRPPPAHRRLGLLPGGGGEAVTPADASILIVGDAGVGKSALASALQTLARRGGHSGPLSIGELREGSDLPSSLEAMPELVLVLVVWEAALDASLPAYVAR